jgi:hypothetical protein
MPAEDNHRDKEAEYRRHAVELQKLAKQTQDEGERETLLRMARAWLGLAARIRLLSEGDR